MFVEKQRVAEWCASFWAGKTLQLWPCVPMGAAGNPSCPILVCLAAFQLGGGTLDIALNTGREEESSTYWLALPHY